MLSKYRQRVIFALFFTTGFCALLHVIVWQRLALIAFSAAPPVVGSLNSIVLLGIALGSWITGAFISRLRRRTKLAPLYFYAVGEIVTATSAFVVPEMFALCHRFVAHLASFDSFEFAAASTTAVAVSTLPFTFFMGAAFPMMMTALGERGEVRDRSGFGALYLANALGGIGAAFAAAYVLIELNGLRGTLVTAAELNVVAALVAALLQQRWSVRGVAIEGLVVPASSAPDDNLVANPEAALVVLGFFLFGSQAVWARLGAPILGTSIYGPTYLLMLYLLGSSVGAWLYLKLMARRELISAQLALQGCILFGLLQAVFLDTRLGLGVPGLALAILPVCVSTGYLAPLLIGLRRRARHAGRVYAWHVLGCLLGPPVIAYALLPRVDGPGALLLLSVPLIALSVAWGARQLPAIAVPVALALYCIQIFDPGLGASLSRVVFRDQSATVSVNGGGREASLAVDAVTVARLSSDDKLMALYPLLVHEGKPVRAALLVGLGTGTGLISAMKWAPKLQITVVERLPGVLRAFDVFYPAEARAARANPALKIVVDEPRRYLERVDAKYDVIVVNPAASLESASSSLLYSVEFYQLAKSRLNEGGILQQWYPISEYRTLEAVMRSVLLVFPYVRASRSIESDGVHLLGSGSPIARLEAARLTARLPAAAAQDLLTWLPERKPREVFDAMLARPLRPTALVDDSEAVVITDDRPFNEYFKVRRSGN